HIGVLACLAEFDLLRYVEVLSCVSGGSIIGAYYYLELRALLRQKSDAELTPRDYVELVRRVEQRFFAGVESDIRASVVIGAGALAKLFFKPGFSATERLAELYEREIFARVGDDVPRRMRDLHVIPKGESVDFTPKLHNLRRRAKVPTLVLNATSLNTGHNWQFRLVVGRVARADRRAR
ncbi:MAG TPA: hypothetical protein PLV92_20250, partial [Pirellulaceae bacterium]|nr:hypothetical protein [Pirellulaceae bacterium]